MQPPTTWPAPTVADHAARAEPGRSPLAPPRWERVGRALAAGVAAGAIAAAIGLDRPPSSVGVALAIAAVAAGTVAAVGATGRTRLGVVAAVAAFAPWLALRSSPWLLVPDAIALAVAGVVALTLHRGATVLDSGRGFRRRARVAAVGAAVAPTRAVLGARATMPPDRRVRLRRTVGPALLGIGLALVVTLVLASGDALFASYLDAGGSFGTLAGRFGAALVALGLVTAGSGVAVASERRDPIPARRWSSTRSAIVASCPLVAVYVGYVAVQCSTLALGADYVHERTGLTFAEYARSGFFQLVGVALLTFAGLTVIRPIARDACGRARRVLLAIAVVATACTLAMVVAAVVKLDLYADAFGLTMLRLHTTVFAVWLGLALVIALVAVLRPHREWVVPVVAATALAGVLVMNAIDPERVVAEHNLTHTIESDEFDIDYLLGLSDDAVPTIVAHLDDLSPADRDTAVAVLCSRHAGVASSGLDWNLARRRAASALDASC